VHADRSLGLKLSQDAKIVYETIGKLAGVNVLFDPDFAARFGSASGYGSIDYFQNVEVAAVQVRLGEFNAAFESLERAREKHDTNIIYLKVDPFWDDVRSEPRFQSLLRRMGLEGKTHGDRLTW